VGPRFTRAKVADGEFADSELTLTQRESRPILLAHSAGNLVRFTREREIDPRGPKGPSFSRYGASAPLTDLGEEMHRTTPGFSEAAGVGLTWELRRPSTQVAVPRSSGADQFRSVNREQYNGIHPPE